MGGLVGLVGLVRAVVTQADHRHQAGVQGVQAGVGQLLFFDFLLDRELCPASDADAIVRIPGKARLSVK